MIKKILKIILYLLIIVALGSNFYFDIKTVKGLNKGLDSLKKTVITLFQKPNFKKLKLATIQIKVGKAGGAGIIYKIDEKYLYVLTVSHALRQKGNIEVWIYNDKQKIIKVKNVPRENTYTSKEVDLALVKVPKPKEKITFIPLAKSQPDIGDKIYTIGHPFAIFYYSVNVGIVTNYRERTYQNIKGNYMMISAPSYRGNSGGAVINCNTEVVGIVSGVMHLPKGTFTREMIKLHNIAFTVKLKDIEKFLRELK